MAIDFKGFSLSNIRLPERETVQGSFYRFRRDFNGNRVPIRPLDSATQAGFGATAGGDLSSAFGYRANACADGTVAAGTFSFAGGARSVAIGAQVNVEAAESVGIGDRANVKAVRGGAIGFRVLSSGERSWSIGHLGAVTGSQSVGFGHAVSVTSNDSVGIGSDVSVTGNDSVGIGSQISVTGIQNVVIGTDSSAGDQDNVIIGHGAGGFTGKLNVLIGLSAVNANGIDSAVAVGQSTQVTVDAGIAVGPGSKSTHAYAMSLGGQAQSAAAQQLTIGAANVFGSHYDDFRVGCEPNGQRWHVKSLDELVTIAAAATTDSTIQIPADCIVIGVSMRVTVQPTGTTTTDYGVAGATTRYGTGISTAANTTHKGLDDALRYYSAAAAIRFTPNVAPSDAAGRIRITIKYIDVTPPTS